ncbi:MAG: DMT family transporter [Pseudooceanicola sp.]
MSDLQVPATAAEAEAQRRATFTGILLMAAGVTCLSVNDALAKALVDRYSPLQLLFLRNLIALPVALVLVLRLGGTAHLRSRNPGAHLLRGLLWIGGTVSFFTSFRYLGLAEATALIFVAPIFITALSAILLRDDVGWRCWLAVLAGFAGVLVIVRPGGAAFQSASLLPVCAAVFYACMMISARWVDPRESVWTLLFYLTGTSVLLSAFVVPFVWVEVRAGDIGHILGIAAFGTAGVTMLTQAFRFAPAAIVAPFDYTAIIWATAFGWIFWNEIPDGMTYLGAAIIIASGIFIIWREHRAAR